MRKVQRNKITQRHTYRYAYRYRHGIWFQWSVPSSRPEKRHKAALPQSRIEVPGDLGAKVRQLCPFKDLNSLGGKKRVRPQKNAMGLFVRKGKLKVFESLKFSQDSNMPLTKKLHPTHYRNSFVSTKKNNPTTTLRPPLRCRFASNSALAAWKDRAF